MDGPLEKGIKWASYSYILCWLSSQLHKMIITNGLSNIVLTKIVFTYVLVFLFNPSDQMWYPILSRFWVARIFWHILTESGFDFDIPFSMTSRKKAEFLLSSLLSLVALPRSKHVHYTNALSFCSPENKFGRNSCKQWILELKNKCIALVQNHCPLSFP